MPGTDNREPEDVLPPAGASLMILLWLSLFAGRWIAVNFLLAIRVLTADQVAFWDERILLPCYAVLFSITLIVVVLRAVRVHQGPAGSTPAPRNDARSQSPSSLRASTTGADPRD